MKWTSHRLVTGISVFAITNNPVFAIIAAEGSIFPDKVEYIFNDWQKHHRKTSHWFPIYLVLLYLLYIFLNENKLFINNNYELLNIFSYSINDSLKIIFSNVAFWYFIGSIFHIIEDSFCGEIPIFYPNQKVKFMKLFYVGTFKEYVFVFVFCSFILFIKYKLIL